MFFAFCFSVFGRSYGVGAIYLLIINLSLSWVICTRKMFYDWVRAVRRNVIIKIHGEERRDSLMPSVR